MTLPPTLPAYERAARDRLGPEAAAYLFGGAGGEETLAANAAALARFRLSPRAFAAFDARPLDLFGDLYAAPILVAPIGYQRLFDPQGEAASARAAAALGLGYVVPTLSSVAMESVRDAAEGAPQWFQLYLQPERAQTLHLVRRAEACGARAIVVTADAPVDGVRDRQVEAGFRLPADIRPVHLEALPRPAGRPDGPSPAPGWDAFAWLRAQTRLPLLVKGVMRAEDARRAMQAGADGVIVSNHGGRVLDGAVGALEALPDIAAAVEGHAPVLFDSGIRRGTDIAKALRLGAAAVLVGRPVVCGLAVAGDRGAAHVLRMLVEEFRLADALSAPALVERAGGAA